MRGENVISLWVPLDPAGPDNGVVQYVKGSHKWGVLYRPEIFTQREQDKEAHVNLMASWQADEFPTVPDIDAHPDDCELLTWSLQPGDLILHHPLTIHGSKGNPSTNRRRRAIAERYVGDGVTYQSGKNGDTFFDLLVPFFGDVGLSNGDQLGGSYFPKAWPR